ncbi:MAG: metallophosphoesterase [Bacteroidales bacterium]|nr:metallophosphoesterase [Bacteroidales bacterium]
MNKRWVIPDIHGCSKTLRSLVEQQIKPDLSDELFFLGDFIDRGPDSKGVIDFLMKLQEDGYNTKFLLGNHEDYCVKAWEEDFKKKPFLGMRFKGKIQSVWELHGGKETLASFGAKFASEIPQQYIDWMRKLKMYLELDKFILVHAGFNFNIDDPLTDTFAMLWTREFKVNPAKIRNKKVIHGHVPVDLEFLDHVVKSTHYHFVDLDNGVYMESRAGYGNLIALELNSWEYVVQTNIDL